MDSDRIVFPPVHFSRAALGYVQGLLDHTLSDISRLRNLKFHGIRKQGSLPWAAGIKEYPQMGTDFMEPLIEKKCRCPVKK